MANSFVQYSADGANYSVPFQYISKAHVHVYVSGVEVPYTWLSVNTVVLASVPAQGAIVEIRRITPSDALIVDYIDGSILTSTDLDLSATHNLFLAQETEDTADTAINLGSDGTYDVSGRRIKNVADAVEDGDVVNARWAKNAMGSQLALAIGYRADAVNAAAAAATARDVAGVSRDAAGASQTAAKASQDAAAGSASSAAGSASTATQKASDASNSATASAASQVAAKTSETNAGTSASAALSSSQSASTSAGQADTSARNAAASATNAAGSASDSLAAALRAEQAANNAATGGYTKNETDAKLADKADKASTYSKTQVDSAITSATNGKADASATTAALADKLSMTAGGTVAGRTIFNNTAIGSVGMQDLQGSGMGAITVSSKGTVQQSTAALEFLNAGRGSAYLGLDWDFTLKFGGGAYGNQVYRIFHQGNLSPIQGIRLTFAGDQTGPNIEGVSMNQSGNQRAGDIVEPYAGAVVTGAAGRNDLWDLLYGLRFRYLQVKDQDGNWTTVSYS